MGRDPKHFGKDQRTAARLPRNILNIVFCIIILNIHLHDIRLLFLKVRENYFQIAYTCKRAKYPLSTIKLEKGRRHRSGPCK